MSLYLTLPSNSSAQYFDGNTPSHYFTKLPQPIELSGEWEVGLAELQFINTFSNVPDEQIWLTYKRSGPAKDVTRLIDPTVHSGGRAFTDITQKVTLKGGFYESSEVFIQALNKASEEEVERLPNNNHPVYFKYNPATRKVSLRVFEDNAFVKLSKSLQDILGFYHNTYHGPGTFTSDAMVDVNQDYKSMFVYCDLASPRPVGDAMVPLLRTLPIVADQQKVVHAIFDKPHYIPLGRFQFDTVEILITSDLGQELSFPQGHTVVTLHYRHKRSEAYVF